MTYQEAIDIIIGELPIPAGQAWVTIAEIVEKAKEIDDDKNRRNDRLDS